MMAAVKLKIRPDSVAGHLPLELENGGEPRSYGLSAPCTDGIQDNKKMEQAEE